MVYSNLESEFGYIDWKEPKFDYGSSKMFYWSVHDYKEIKENKEGQSFVESDDEDTKRLDWS